MSILLSMIIGITLSIFIVALIADAFVVASDWPFIRKINEILFYPWT
jgi:hypothetical protein